MLIIIFIPLIFSFIYYDILSLKKKQIDKFFIIKWSILFSYLTVFILYGLQGGAGPGLIFYIFPIASTISINQLIKYFKKTNNTKEILFVYLSIFILLQASMTAIIVNNTDDNQLEANFNNVYTSSHWYFKHTPLENNATRSTLTDFNTAGFYAINGAKTGYFFDYNVWKPNYYEIYFKDNQNTTHEYIIINIRDLGEPIYIDQGWNRLQPLSTYQTELNANENINKIYADSTFSIHNIN
jgi:hypothetical protein